MQELDPPSQQVTRGQTTYSKTEATESQGVIVHTPRYDKRQTHPGISCGYPEKVSSPTPEPPVTTPAPADVLLTPEPPATTTPVATDV